MREIVRDFILPGLSFLPVEMNTPAARAMLFAIGMQESRFEYRRQNLSPYGYGPARGFWQFEKGGISGVMLHNASREHIVNVCKDLVIYIESDFSTVYEAIAYNDPLACCFARLLLWTLPGDLPEMNEPQKGWDQYLAAWRPGKPHPESWKSYFNTAWMSI